MIKISPSDARDAFVKITAQATPVSFERRVSNRPALSRPRFDLSFAFYSNASSSRLLISRSTVFNIFPAIFHLRSAIILRAFVVVFNGWNGARDVYFITAVPLKSLPSPPEASSFFLLLLLFIRLVLYFFSCLSLRQPTAILCNFLFDLSRRTKQTGSNRFTILANEFSKVAGGLLPRLFLLPPSLSTSLCPIVLPAFASAVPRSLRPNQFRASFAIVSTRSPIAPFLRRYFP